MVPPHFYPLISGSVNPGYSRNSLIYWMLIQSINNLWRILPQFCNVLLPSWHYNCLQQAIPPFFQANSSRMVGNMVRPMNSWAWAHSRSSFAVKWDLWSQAMCYHGIWTSYSVSPWVVVLAEILHVRKANHIQNVYSSKNKTFPFLWRKVSSVINPAASLAAPSSTAGSAASCSSRGRVACTAAWTCCRAFSSFGLHSK